MASLLLSNNDSLLYPLAQLPVFRSVPLVGSFLGDGSLEDTTNCTNGIGWILHVFGDCVDTNLKLAGFIIGFVSLLLWLVPLIPQLLQNYRSKHCDGLSIFFLLFWLIGDTCNMTGAMLTNQQPIQKIIGVYYIIQDFAMLSQFFYYTKIYPNKYVFAVCCGISTLLTAIVVLGRIFSTPIVYTDFLKCEDDPTTGQTSYPRRHRTYSGTSCRSSLSIRSATSAEDVHLPVPLCRRHSSSNGSINGSILLDQLPTTTVTAAQRRQPPLYRDDSLTMAVE